MRIGLDFDGTIADITWAKIRYAREAFGVELLPEQTSRSTGIPVLGVVTALGNLARPWHRRPPR